MQIAYFGDRAKGLLNEYKELITRGGRGCCFAKGERFVGLGGHNENRERTYQRSKTRNPQPADSDKETVGNDISDSVIGSEIVSAESWPDVVQKASSGLQLLSFGVSRFEKPGNR